MGCEGADATRRRWIAEYVIPFKTLRFSAASRPRNGACRSPGVFLALNEESRLVAAAIPLSGHETGSGRNAARPRKHPPGPQLQSEAVRHRTRHQARVAGHLRWRDWDYDGGFDVKYSLTPSLTLDATYRTDFAQVEADQQQVNLTRFNLFFPEKREFFLENSGIFAFGTGPRQSNLVRSSAGESAERGRHADSHRRRRARVGPGAAATTSASWR